MADAYPRAPSESPARLDGYGPALGYCWLLLRELDSRQLDLRAHLAAHDITALPRPASTGSASPAQFLAFLQAVEELADDPGLGLHAGMRIELQDLGLIGLLLRSSPDGWSARAYYERFRDLLPYASDLEVSIDEHLIVSRRPLAGFPCPPIVSDCFLTRTLTCMRHLFGPVEPREVRVAQARPSDLRAHERIFGERLRFEQAEDALVFSSELLSRALPHGDSAVAEVLARHLARGPIFTKPVSGDLTGRVVRAIREELGHGRTTTRRVASRLKLSERTMRRHLRQRGTGFQKLLDEVRRDQALRHLHASKCTSSELGARLGFKGEAAFCRAFRRWTGTSFSEYRAQQTATRVLHERDENGACRRECQEELS
ncbi:MAG TPA: AraC family transcriptional regulator ligand-binding domain-containing protein [Polyangiaceae bacterium]|nr:AraC family transcriptional regulator ligand-binding domain-containing protein [Polyangiaceae bacterium]